MTFYANEISKRYSVVAGLLAFSLNAFALGDGASTPGCKETQPAIPDPKGKWQGIIDTSAKKEIQWACEGGKMAGRTYQGVPPAEASAIASQKAGLKSMSSAGEAVKNTTGAQDASQMSDQQGLASSATGNAGTSFGQCLAEVQRGAGILNLTNIQIEVAENDPSCPPQADAELCQPIAKADYDKLTENYNKCRAMFTNDPTACDSKLKEEQEKAKKHFEQCRTQEVNSCIAACAKSIAPVKSAAATCGGALGNVAGKCNSVGQDAKQFGGKSLKSMGDMSKLLDALKGGGGDKKKPEDKPKENAGTPPATPDAGAGYTPPDASVADVPDLGLTDWESETPTAMDMSAGAENSHDIIGDKQLLTSTPAEQAAAKSSAYDKKYGVISNKGGGIGGLDADGGGRALVAEENGVAPFSMDPLGGGLGGNPLLGLGNIPPLDASGNLLAMGNLNDLQSYFVDSEGNKLHEMTGFQLLSERYRKKEAATDKLMEKMEHARKGNLKVTVPDAIRSPASIAK